MAFFKEGELEKLLKLFSNGELDDITNFVEIASSFKPIIRMIISTSVDILKEFEPSISGFDNYIIDKRIERFNRLTSAGFTRSEALWLMQPAISAKTINKFIENFSKEIKKNK